MQELYCDHCGDKIGKVHIHWADKNFCCEGCKTVYQLLNESKLSEYYSLYEAPGIKVNSENFGGKFAYLDNPEISKKVCYFSEGNFTKVLFYIPEIHCSSCIWLLENLYKLNSSISLSTVNFIKKEVDITFNHSEITLRQLVELLASIHYVPNISLESVDGIKQKSKTKTLLLKIGVAGFSFGNTMLLSMPEYIPGSKLLDENFQTFFGYINIALALPVLLFSARDYFESAYKNIKHRIINIDFPISIGILAIFIESCYEIFSGSGSGYMDSLAGLVFFLLIGKWYQSYSYHALSFERDYKSYFPIAVTKIIDGKESTDLIENLKAGDVVLVRNQELIPADGILIQGHSNINYSFVSGESKPIQKSIGDEVYAGGKQIGSSIQIQITKEVLQSRLTQLWNQNFETESSTKNLSSIINTLSKRFTVFILTVATIASIIWYFIDSSNVIIVFSSVLIVACPCALALSIPFSYGNTQRIYGRAGFYLKNTQVVEDLHAIDTIVFDKTGTITFTDSHSVEFHGKNLSTEEEHWIKSTCFQSAHPLSQSIFSFLNATYKQEIEGFREVPAAGVVGQIEGHEIRLGSPSFIEVVNPTHFDSGSIVYVSIDKEIRGYFTIKNQFRNGAEEVIAELSKKFECHLISGDNDSDKERMQQLFGDSSKILFNQSPQDKLAYIQRLKSLNKSVLMVGDGLNDAGALKESRVGISIADDIFQFSPACDGILQSDVFEKLPLFISSSKKSIRIVYMSFAISFMYNIVGLYFAVSAQLSPIVAAILMPASSITVVAFISLASRLMLRKLKTLD